MKKKVLALLLCVCLVLALAACGSSSSSSSDSTSSSGSTSSGATTSEDTSSEDTSTTEESTFDGVRAVTVGISADINTWEPWGAFNIGRQNMAAMIYQNLTADIMNNDTKTFDHYNVMAESTEYLGDHVYQIVLRQGIYDSQGNEFTASDAIFSFNGCKEAGKMTQADAIESMELIDDYTFTMTLTEAGDTEGNFEDICAAINMVTQAAYEASDDGMALDPVGTGPWVLDSYTSGSGCVMVKSDSYWNAAANESKNVDDGYCSMWDDTQLDQLEYVFITNENSMAIALENGEIDIARAINSEDAAIFESDDAYDLFVEAEGSYGVTFNASSSSPTSNLNLRLAIAYCIDSEMVLDAACDGLGTVATSWSYPYFTDYQSEWDSWDYFGYDMDKAQSYLDAYCEETGVNASDISLTILLQSEDIAEGVATAIQYSIGELTGNPTCCTITSYDRSTTTQTKQDPTQFDLFIENGQIATRTTACYDWDANCNIEKQGWSIFHEEDDQLQNLLHLALNVDTHSDQTVSDFQNYVNDMCYMKNLIWADEYGAAASWISNLDEHLGAKDCLNVGALDYDWANSGK